MNPSNSSALLADLAKLAPPVDRVIPVEEWDWDEIRRLEDIVRERYQRFPRCEKCSALMVLAQVRTHHSCRPPAPVPSKPKLRGR